MAQSRALLFFAAIAVALMGAGLGLWIFLGREPRANPDNREQIAAGEKIYAANCAACHGAKLEGEPNWKVRKQSGRLPAPPHDATGHTWHHSDEQLFGIVKDGLTAYAPAGYATDMPAFKDILSDADIRAVLAYIKSTWPQDIKDHHRQISAPPANN
ncbi:MAG: hypothetical protein RJB58_2427 [Pseudomonadota bacterium]|jgi:mono/diheme cytochrome c family protein